MDKINQELINQLLIRKLLSQLATDPNGVKINIKPKSTVSERSSRGSVPVDFPSAVKDRKIIDLVQTTDPLLKKLRTPFETIQYLWLMKDEFSDTDIKELKRLLNAVDPAIEEITDSDDTEYDDLKILQEESPDVSND